MFNIVKLLVLSLGVLAHAGQSHAQGDVSRTASVKSSGTPIVIYEERLRTTNVNSRGWPTVRLLRKVGDSAPETLAEVGTVGEYPTGYQLSPDRRYLLINLESKLKILDLGSKAVTDLFVPKRQVLSMLYSPDGKEVLVWDQRYVPTDGINSYYLHRINMSDRTSQIAMQGESEDYRYLGAWRDDQRIILHLSHPHFSTPYFLDLSDKRIHKTPGNFNSGLQSKSGKLMAVGAGTIADPCNDMYGTTPNVYKIIDPVSGIARGNISSRNERLVVLAFSSDDREVLFLTETIPTSWEGCTKSQSRTFWRNRIGTNTTTQTRGPLSLPPGWNNDYLGISVRHDSKNRAWSIFFDERPVVTSKEPLRIIAQFYRG